MKKKLWLVLALVAALVLALALVGCGGTEDEGTTTGDDGAVAEGTKITVILPDNEMDNIGLHRERTEQFTAETGIEVELINKGWEAAADDILADLASGGGSYDVIEFDNAWIAKFVENGWVAPLNEYMTDEIKDGMVPGLLDLFSDDGNYYGIVWNNDTRFYMYNSTMLDELGVADAPKTWDEVAELAEKRGDIAYLDTYKQEQMGTNQLMFVVYSFGGEFVDDDGNPVIGTDPGAFEAYTWLQKAYEDKVFGPSSLTIDYEEVAQSFFVGGFPLFLQAWPGVYADSQDPDMSKIVGDIAVADYSVSKTGAEQVVLTLPEAMAITTTSKNKDAAWKYIEYMSSKEFDKERSTKIGSLPIWSDLYNDDELLELYPYWESFGLQAQHSRGYPVIVWVDDFADIVAKVSQKILAGNIGVQEGLDEMQKLMEDAKAMSEQ
ncbi:MAG: sugar ABC transporter substrate-binding protein [Coriobacteriia bacterium]|nr:sugar ABC transporter substrate-binding protein [Coriobacteriia bacterium]